MDKELFQFILHTQVEVIFQPSTAYFPELNQNELYQCFFENSELQYNFTTPFNGTTCIIQDVLMPFNGSVIGKYSFIPLEAQFTQNNTR